MRLSTSLAWVARRIGVRAESKSYRALRRNYWGLRSASGRRYYSQFGEDVALLNIFRDYPNGAYVDVGAGHPTQGSNTYALYRTGWQGILVDPLSHHRRLAQLIRPRDKYIQSLCGSEAASTTLYEFDLWQLSTTSVEAVDRLAREGFLPVEAHVMNVRTLSSLNLSASPDLPSLLSLDVEGMEESVLEGNDWESFRPAVVCIEQWESPLLGQSQVRLYLERLGYNLFNYIGNSGIYVHRVWKG